MPICSLLEESSPRSKREGDDAWIENQGAKEEKKTSFTEAGARSWRYQSCQRIATFHKYRILQVGHTASDRIETGLFNLLRFCLGPKTLA